MRAAAQVIKPFKIFTTLSTSSWFASHSARAASGKRNSDQNKAKITRKEYLCFTKK